MAQKHKAAAKPARRAPRASARASAAPPVAAASAPARARELRSSGSAGDAAAIPARKTAGAVTATCAPLSLGASLSIREVSECAARLKAQFAAGSAEVDAHQLESIDTAGLQLLLAAATAAQRRGLKLRLSGAASLNSGAALALGLAEQLAAAAEILP